MDAATRAAIRLKYILVCCVHFGAKTYFFTGRSSTSRTISFMLLNSSPA